jgi:hypothetical protein
MSQRNGIPHTRCNSCSDTVVEDLHNLQQDNHNPTYLDLLSTGEMDFVGDIYTTAGETPSRRVSDGRRVLGDVN